MAMRVFRIRVSLRLFPAMLQIASSSYVITLSPQPSRQALRQIKELGDGTFVAIASSAGSVLDLMCEVGAAYRHALYGNCKPL
jgi:hypothetical protein